MSEANKALIRRHLEIFNAWNVALVDELLAPDVSFRAAGFTEVKGREAFRQLIPAIRTAFPDGKFTIETIIAEGDVVAVRWHWRGTHQGAYMGIAATGKQVTETGTSFYRIAEGQITEIWGDEDALGLMQQLGGIPK
jgi:steroid delta-isomerase-like uncharacterized protein